MRIPTFLRNEQVMSLKLFSISLVEAEVSCAVGTDCLLPCRFVFASSVSIHWRKTLGEIQVHSYYDAQDQLLLQHPDYTDRTDLRGVIREGNATLRIKNVKVQDEGRYVCFTSTSSDSSISFVNLHVFERGVLYWSAPPPPSSSSCSFLLQSFTISRLSLTCFL
uniref:Ig-like domain-containing protein n=1 Tax=Neogobius melanostomus TaxID=47308 RepID=A0A8C6SHW7_9GOBI